jgi:hypothetical protein
MEWSMLMMTYRSTEYWSTEYRSTILSLSTPEYSKYSYSVLRMVGIFFDTLKFSVTAIREDVFKKSNNTPH